MWCNSRAGNVACKWECSYHPEPLASFLTSTALLRHGIINGLMNERRNSYFPVSLSPGDFGIFSA